MNSNKLLKNKTILVTGANKGIGLAIVKSLLESGAEVLALVRSFKTSDLKALKELSDRNKLDIFSIDLDDEKSIKVELKKIIKKYENIYGLVNNAGQIYNGLLQMTPQTEFNNMFNINFFAPVTIIQTIVRKMMKNKSGSIVNISSTSAEDCALGRSAYSSSKAALETMTKTLAYELGRYNIRANCVLPGLTNTKLMRNNTNEKVVEEVIRNIALGRVAEPKEIAELVNFLCSDKSSYITAQSIRVDGGMIR